MTRRLRAAAARVLASVRQDHHDRQFDAELEAHLAMAIEEYRRRGLDPVEARRRALLDLGGAQPARDLHRDTRGLPQLEMLLQDVAYAFRNLRRTPGFTMTALLILALGIGANTLVFSIVHTLLLRPLPLGDPERLVWIANDYEGNEAAGLSGVASLTAMLEEWQRRTTSFEALSGYNAFFAYGSNKLAGGGEPERVVAVGVARDLFDVLGVPIAAGRGFTAEEAAPNGPPAVILSHGLWQRRFGADPRIVGSRVTYNDRPATVVGVLPSWFDFGGIFAPGVRVDLFEPLVFEQARQWGNTLAVVGRLKPGVSLEQSRSEMATLIPQILGDRPEWGTGHGARLVPLREHVSGHLRPAVLALAGGVGAVLLIVCANLASLLLSRGSVRRRELAIRAALGAGRRRLVRQMLTETLVLCGAGAAVGLLAAAAAARALASAEGMAVPLMRDVAVDFPAAAFTAAVTIAAALLAGVFPALQLSRANLQHSLTDGARGSTSPLHGRVRNSLVVAEIALACMLLVCAGLLLRSFDRLLSVDLGFAPDHAVVVKIEPNRTITDTDVRREFAAEAVRRAAAVPGVTAAGLTDTLPLDRDRAWGIGVPGRTFQQHEAPVAHVRMVGAGYFAAMRIRLRDGRVFTESEALRPSDLVVVNATMARRLWPNERAVDREILVGNKRTRIIGVVDDVRHMDLAKPAAMEMYLPIGRFSIRSADLIVRGDLPAEQLAASVRAALRPLDPSMPLQDVRPLQALVDRAVSPRRLYTGLLAAFAAAALVLAALGVFGVISYGVSRRRTEIGIRMALGATASSVWHGILREALGLAALGLVLGLLCALAVTRGLSSLLFGVSPTDPVTMAVAAGVILMIATLASALPARRAARVDPIIALRTD